MRGRHCHYGEKGSKYSYHTSDHDFDRILCSCTLSLTTGSMATYALDSADHLATACHAVVPHRALSLTADRILCSCTLSLTTGSMATYTLDSHLPCWRQDQRL